MASSDVVVLFGGASFERLVSVASAQNVSAQLPDAALWFWSKAGPVFVVNAAQLAAHQRAFEHEFVAADGARSFASLEAALDAEGRGHTFFLALHGGAGENGSVQRLMEARKLAFTGSDAAASARAFDKAEAKRLAGLQGVRLAQAQILEASGDAKALEAMLHGLFKAAERWVLKPVADGSSFGLIHLTSSEQVAGAAKQLSEYTLRYLAEAFIAGRELTVGVFDEANGPSALPVSEVRLAKDAAFDYAGKYLGGKGTEEITPAHLTPSELAAAQHVAITAHRAVGCFGYSRTDMILSSEGPVFLEINTLPGLTRASFIPQQVAAAGRALKPFLEHQLELARQRAQAALR